MRPIKLTFQAVGPFVEKQTIDFEKYYDDGIFLIHGDTGSGKTFILDCITLSLYGVGSGADRPTIQFCRSQLADDKTPTEVEFTFELKGKLYTFSRTLMLKRNNEVTKAEAFYYENDIKIPFFSNPTLSKVNDKAMELIGLNANQFTQVIILPQGKFEQFLVGDSNEKRKVLTCLFDLEFWRGVVETLRKNLNNIKAEYEQKENFIADTLLRMDLNNLQELKQQTQNLKKEIANSKAEYQDKKTELTKSQIKKTQQAEIFNKFVQLDEAVQKRLVLSKKEEEHKLNATKIAKIENAIALDGRYLTIAEMTEKTNFLNAEITALNKQGKLDASMLALVQETYIKLTNQKLDIDKSKNQLENCRNKRQVYTDISSVREKVVQLEKMTLNNSSKEDELNREYLSLKEKHKALNLTQQTRYEKFVKSFNNVIEQYNQAQKTVDAKNEIKVLTAKVKDIKNACDTKNKNYLLLNSENLKNASQFLKSNIHNGDICPVCNNVYTGKDTTETLIHNNVVIDLKTLQDEINSLNVDLATTNNKILNLNAVISGSINIDDNLLNKAKEKLLLYKNENDAYEIASNELKLLNSSVENALNKYNLFKAKSQSEKLEYITQQAKLTALKSQLIPNIDNLVALETFIEQMIKKVDSFEKNFYTCTNELNSLNNSMAANSGKLQSATIALNNLTAESTLKVAQFEAELKKYGFINNTDFAETLKTKCQLNKLKQDYKLLENDINIIDNSIFVLKAELASKQRVDILSINLECEQIEKLATLLLEQLTIKIEQLRQLGETLSDLTIKQTESTVVSQKYSRLKQFTDLLAGNAGTAVGIQNYCLAAMLTKIIAEANKILKNVLSDNFRLYRTTQKRGREKDIGLELDVLDLSSNQQRSVRTLSGGEKFIIALSLSMGLSNVLMLYANGVKIDMLFIDEGFGTLSEGRIKDALDILLKEKSEKRLIGIISHVQKIYDSIPSKIYVCKNRTSSIKQ